jgi:hypothetical protein
MTVRFPCTRRVKGRVVPNRFDYSAQSGNRSERQNSFWVVPRFEIASCV